jgi:hypothetical protein
LKSIQSTSPLRVPIHVELANLQFPQRGGRRVRKLTFVQALPDHRELALEDATCARFSQSGGNPNLPLDRPRRKTPPAASGAGCRGSRNRGRHDPVGTASQRCKSHKTLDKGTSKQ